MNLATAGDCGLLVWPLAAWAIAPDSIKALSSAGVPQRIQNSFPAITTRSSGAHWGHLLSSIINIFLDITIIGYLNISVKLFYSFFLCIDLFDEAWYGKLTAQSLRLQG